MLARVVFLLILMGLAMLAAWEKQRLRRLISRKLPEDAIETPFSRALMELVGIAGGIYLGLVMLITFLGIDIPEKINFFGIFLDPVALLAVFLTLIQPLVMRLWYGFKTS